MAKYFVAILLLAFGVTSGHSETRVKASYYWEGSRVATGARYNPQGMTTAHRSLPFGTKLRVSYKGRSVVVTVNDRGPFIKGRSLDLSLGAAKAIGLTARGVDYVSYALAGQ